MRAVFAKIGKVLVQDLKRRAGSEVDGFRANCGILTKSTIL